MGSEFEEQKIPRTDTESERRIGIGPFGSFLRNKGPFLGIDIAIGIGL
jgi:hypothetical protein